MAEGYVSLWHGEDADGWQERPSMTVYVACKAPKPTGLFDQFAAPLFRVRDTVPMGFQPPASPRGEG